MPRGGRSRPRRHNLYGSVEVTHEEAGEFGYAEPPIGQGRKWAPVAKAFVAVAAVCAVAAVTVSSWRGGGLSAFGRETSAAPGVHDMTGFRAAQTGRSPVVSAETGDGRAPALPFTVNNKYTARDGDLDKLSVFGGKVLMEPQRETFFAVAGPVAGNLYRWTIGDEVMPQNKEGTATVAFRREQLWETIPFKVEEIPADGGEPLRAAMGEVVLRYVRRELRDLFVEDREAYLSAVEAVYGLSQEEGEAKYGADFVSSTYLVSMHTNLAGARECDHLHMGFGFLPNHVGIGMVYEQALQVVDPSVALHYWDYAKDWETYQDIDTIYAKSQVTSTDMFGPFPTEGGLYELKEGRFGFVRVDRAQDGDVSNSYGILRSVWNNNPSPYVTRYTNRFMGVKQDENGDEYSTDWPSCENYFTFLQNNTGEWTGIGSTIELSVHGRIHSISGGALELTDNYAKINLLLREYDMQDERGLMHAFPYMVHKDLWRIGLKECPQTCSLDTDPTACKCFCNPYNPYSDRDLNQFLYYSFSGRASVQDFVTWPMRFKQQIVHYFCNDAYLAGDHMDSGSPADPSFWAVHGQMERFFMKMSHADLSGDLDDWPTGKDAYMGAYHFDTDLCSGHEAGDLMGWPMVLGGKKGYFTTRQVVEALDPRTQLMPYVYDSHDMPYCAESGYDVDSLFVDLEMDAREARDAAATGAVAAGPVLKELPQSVDLYIVNKGEGSIVRARVEKISSEETTEATVLVDGLVSPKDVYVDVAGEMIYWTDMETAQIARATLEGRERETIVSGTPKPALMAVDILQRRLYWTDMDADAVGYAIRTADMDGGMEFVLMELEAQSKGIALTGGRLYWTEEDKGALLSNPGYTNQNGPVPEAKVLTGLDEPMYLEPHSDTDMFVCVGGTTESGAVVRYSLGEDGEVEGDGEVVLTDVNKADAVRFDATNGLLWVTLYYDGALVAVDLSAAEEAGVTPSMTEHRGVYCIDVVAGLDTPKGLDVVHVAAQEGAL